MKKIILTLYAVLMLSGCTTLDAVLHPSHKSIQEYKAALSVAETAATAYVSRPLCGPQAPPLCSDIVIVRKMKSAKKKAETALTAAQKTENQNTLEAFGTAVDALQQIVSVVSPSN